jgi:peptidoglycan hydrolase-like protein with peptidoglycan-binding domain
MRRPMKFLFPRALLIVLLTVGASSLRADEPLRRIQQSLRDQGFYYGPIDGSPGDETTQAIRRYQIRNGLAVTGQLNEETRQSIEKTGAASRNPGTISRPAPTNRPPPAVSSTPAPATRIPPPPSVRTPAPAPRINGSNDEEGNDDEQDEQVVVRPRTPAPGDRPELRAPPSQPGPNSRPPVNGVPPSVALTILFENTPYEFAPPAVQSDILRRAQFALLRSGFYGGEPDGIPGARTAEALAEFQSANGMRRSGRLDGPTLAALRLLPGRGNRPPDGYYDGRRVGPPPRRVYEGQIVR